MNLVGLLLAACLLPWSTWAQSDAAADPKKAALQQKLAEVKARIAANQAALKTYAYQQHTQILYKGEVKKTQNFSVVTGADGKPQKTSLDPPEQPKQPEASGRRGGRVKEKVVANKVDYMKDYMQQAQQLIAQYLAPNPQKRQQAFAAGTATVSDDGGMTKVVINDYVVPGDAMTLSFDPQAQKLAAINVNSYLGKEKDTVTLVVSFAALPDGINHVASTDLIAKAKNIEVKTTNDNYQKK